MAITRAQQVKQMLKQGGRTGFFLGSSYDIGGGGNPNKPTSSSSNREKGITSRGRGPRGTTGSIKDFKDTPVERPGNRYDTNVEDLLPGDEVDLQVDLDPKDPRRIKDENKNLFITKPANYPKFTPSYLQIAANFNREPNRRFFYERVLKNNAAGLNYTDLEKAYEKYLEGRMSGETDAMGNPIPETLKGNRDEPILFPQGQGIMNQAPEDMDQETETEDDEFKLARAFRADGGRIGFRIGSDEGDVSGREYDAPSSVTKTTNTDTGGGDNNQQTVTAPVKIPKPIKDAINLGGDVSYLKNLIDLNPVGIMKNIGGKLIMNKIIGDQTSLDTEDENMMLADVSAMDIKRKNQFKNLDYGTAKDIGMINPTMTQEEFEGVKSGEITEPTGQFAADGGRIGAAEGGIMDLETGRQMYFLGKLVKKATRAVKKIAKSPIGKAALLYSGAGALGNLAGGSGLAGMFKGFTSPSSFLAKDSLAKIFTREGLGNILVGGTGPSVGGNRGMGKGIIPKFSGLFGKGGELNPFQAITAASVIAGALTPEQEDQAQLLADNTGIDIEEARNAILQAAKENYAMDVRARAFKADGGIMRLGYQEGSKEPVAKKTMPLLDMDGKEMDLREDGGFVPIGRMEKADDVPARLSKNEFVFTADAVRNAGDGNVDKGEVMYNMMKNLESGGDVSEESQGLEGARRMFQTSKRLEEVL